MLPCDCAWTATGMLKTLQIVYGMGALLLAASTSSVRLHIYVPSHVHVYVNIVDCDVKQLIYNSQYKQLWLVSKLFDPSPLCGCIHVNYLYDPLVNIPSQQRWRGYSNAAVRGWLGEWVVGSWVGGWVRGSVPLYLVDTIATTVFAQSLSNFTCAFTMMRGGTLLILGHRVQGILWICDGRGHQNGPMAPLLIKCR